MLIKTAILQTNILEPTTYTLAITKTTTTYPTTINYTLVTTITKYSGMGNQCRHPVKPSTSKSLLVQSDTDNC